MILAAGSLYLGVVAGCLIWIPISIGIVSLVGWMIQGEVDALFGIVAVLVLLVVGGLSLVSPHQKDAPYLCLAAFSAVLLFPVVRRQKDRRDFAKLDMERLEKAYEDLRKNPKNIGALLKVAAILQSRGLTGQAVVLAEETLKHAPKGVFEEEHRTLKQWKREPIAQPVPGITCLDCGMRNKAGIVFCSKCKAPILLYYAKGHWMNPFAMRKLLLFWLAVIVPLVGLPVTTELLGVDKRVPIAVMLLGVSAMLIIVALRVPKDVDA